MTSRHGFPACSANDCHKRCGLNCCHFNGRIRRLTEITLVAEPALRLWIIGRPGYGPDAVLGPQATGLRTADAGFLGLPSLWSGPGAKRRGSDAVRDWCASPTWGASPVSHYSTPVWPYTPVSRGPIIGSVATLRWRRRQIHPMPPSSANRRPSESAVTEPILQVALANRRDGRHELR